MKHTESIYYKQSLLLLRVLPLLHEYQDFALKGGTAINFFIRNMPRLSVDIDLVYLPIETRDKTLSQVSSQLISFANRASKLINGLKFRTLTMRNSTIVSKLLLKLGDVQIKIEPNLVIRGTVSPCASRTLVPMAQERFRLTAEVKTLALAEIYAGKICAALDRQHPRDLFDVKLLLDNQGITREIAKAFIVYLASHDRPMHELLDPNLKDISIQFENEFFGLSRERIVLDDLIVARERLIRKIKSELSEHDRKFLLTLKSGDPDWDLIEFVGVEKLPAIRWKLLNIRKMSSRKREKQLKLLRKSLEER